MHDGTGQIVNLYEVEEVKYLTIDEFCELRNQGKTFYY